MKCYFKSKPTYERPDIVTEPQNSPNYPKGENVKKFVLEKFVLELKFKNTSPIEDRQQKA